MKYTIKTLSLLLALTMLTACGTGASGGIPTTSDFARVCEARGAVVNFHDDEDTMGVAEIVTADHRDAPEWLLRYFRPPSAYGLRQTYQDNVKSVEVRGLESFAESSQKGYRTAYWRGADQFVCMVYGGKVIITASGDRDAETTIREILAEFGIALAE